MTESICHECVFRVSKSPTEARCKRYPSFSVDAVDQCTGFRSLDSLSPSKRQIGGDHYTRHAIQPWDAMREWMTPEQFKGFLRGNAIKYIARCEDKGGAEDIDKAIHYLQRLAEEMRT